MSDIAVDQAMNLFQRLHAVMCEVDYIQKEKKSGMKYSIVSHDAVTAKVRPLLVKHRVMYTSSVKSAEQDGTMTKTLVEVTFINIDKPTETHAVVMLGHGIDPQDKGPGKAISYAVKYALLKTLGLETGDDPDQEQDIRKDSRHPATIKLASPEQLGELSELMEASNTPKAISDRWLAKAKVNTFDEMSADHIQKTIDFLKSKLSPVGAA